MGSATAEGASSVADRVFAVLECCGVSDRSVTLANLVELTGLPKTTLHRVCWKLVELGLLERGDNGFRTGTKLFELGAMNPQLRRLRATAMPFLHALANRSGAVINLAVRSGHRALIVDEVFTGVAPSVNRMVGSPMPLHATAIGKALLSGIADDELDALMGAGLLTPYTKWTQVRPNLLRSQLTEIRRTGLAFSREEWKVGVTGVASPVSNGDEVVAALAVVGGPDERLLGDAAGLVRVSAERLGRALQDTAAPVVLA